MRSNLSVSWVIGHAMHLYLLAQVHVHALDASTLFSVPSANSFSSVFLQVFRDIGHSNLGDAIVAIQT